MENTLEKYIPSAAVLPAIELIKTNNVHLKIVSERVTRHGDYRKCQTVNIKLQSMLV